MRLVAASAAALLSVGCIESLAPEVGPLAQSACSDADSDPDTDVSLSREIFAGPFAGSNGCADCHLPMGATPIGITVGGLDLSSHATLRRGGTRSGTDIVIAGEPCSSVLVLKLSEAPPYGARMPLDAPQLSESTRQLVIDWIAEGALDN